MMKRFGKKARIGIQITGVGAITGLFVGIVVTLYNIATSYAEKFARGYYGFFRTHPAFIPLLFVALFLGAIIVGGVTRFLPVVRGSGIPQTEGATRGLLRFKWYQVLTGMFAASLFTIFMGLSAGAEGPSIMLGGACGSGMSDLLRCKAVMRRYHITSGACAGIAVAFNAPLTGMAFAFEEAHKRFTPEVFICSFSSVVVALIVRNVLRPLLGFPLTPFFQNYSFAGTSPFDLKFLAIVLVCSVIVALVGVAFYYLIFLSKKLFDRLNFQKGLFKPVIPFLLAGACGLFLAYVMGGGHHFIEALGSGGSFESPYGMPVWAVVLLIVVFKIAFTAVNTGAGIPCGAFIPMLSVGAGMGALLNFVCLKIGMDSAYSDALIIICMATFFTTVVKAPITGIVMVSELTWSFTFLLPVILGIAVGYLTGSIFRTAPLYDKLLDGVMEEERKLHPVLRLTERFQASARGTAAGKRIRDVLWPSGVIVTLVERGEEKVMPEGNTLLEEGDLITVRAETTDKNEFYETMVSIVGSRIEEEPKEESIRRGV